MGKVLHFRPRRQIACCVACGGHFVQLARHHARCSHCYWWLRAIAALKIANRTMSEMRSE
jgi:hypothetical protein